MSILLISYPGEEYLDILRYRDIAEALSGGHEFYPRSVELLKCDNFKSVATCKQEDACTINIMWSAGQKQKDHVDLGVLTLSWMRQEEVLTTLPYYVKWAGDNGFSCYPIPTLLNGEKG